MGHELPPAGRSTTIGAGTDRIFILVGYEGTKVRGGTWWAVFGGIPGGKLGRNQGESRGLKRTASTYLKPAKFYRVQIWLFA